MSDPQVSPVAFMDGVAVEEVVRIFVAGDLEAGNFNLTRLFYFTEKGKWEYFDVDTVVVSVCARLKPKRSYFALGRDGLVWTKVVGEEPKLERIADAGTGKTKLGRLTQVREIAGQIYACGERGQVYRRGGGGWTHIDVGLVEKPGQKPKVSLNGIDGTAADDIYCVGYKGKIFHFNGKKWTQVGYPTDSILERVRCVSPQEVYVCGDGGVFLKGNRKGWKDLGDPGIKGSIWDLEVFEGKVYLAVEEVLMVYDGKKIAPVESDLDPPPKPYRLSSRNGVLWSFGEKDLTCFDGRTWTRVVHPDNA